MYDALSHLRNRYKVYDPIFYITENGWSMPPEDIIVDDARVEYYRATLESLLDCLDDGINVKGYMAWSLMDNFEWNMGLT